MSRAGPAGLDNSPGWNARVIILYEKPSRVHMGNDSARLGEIPP